MCIGASSYEHRQKKAFLAQERKKKQATKREQNRAKQAENEARRSERDAWLKIHQQKTGEGSWCGLAWLTWPMQWWKDKKAWKKEEAKRAREYNPDHELTGLTSSGLTEPVQEEGAQTSGMASGGPIAESGQLRKRGGGSGGQT